MTTAKLTPAVEMRAASVSQAVVILFSLVILFAVTACGSKPVKPQAKAKPPLMSEIYQAMEKEGVALLVSACAIYSKPLDKSGSAWRSDVFKAESEAIAKTVLMAAQQRIKERGLIVRYAAVSGYCAIKERPFTINLYNNASGYFAKRGTPSTAPITPPEAGIADYRTINGYQGQKVFFTQNKAALLKQLKTRFVHSITVDANVFEDGGRGGNPDQFMRDLAILGSNPIYFLFERVADLTPKEEAFTARTLGYTVMDITRTDNPNLTYEGKQTRRKYEAADLRAYAYAELRTDLLDAMFSRFPP